MSEPEEKTPLDQLEKEMISEVQALFNKYREKLEQYKNAENNGNALNMHSTVWTVQSEKIHDKPFQQYLNMWDNF